MSADNPALKIFLQNRFAPVGGIALAIAAILTLAPAEVQRERLQLWAGFGVVLIIASLLDTSRPGLTKNLLPDGLPLTVNIHAAASGLWLGGVVWIDREAAATNEFAYLAGLLVAWTMLSLLQFGTLGWQAPILMVSAVTAVGTGYIRGGQTMLAAASIWLLGLALHASLSSTRTYAELLRLRKEGANREATATWFANHDPLTGVFNRRGVGDWLEADEVELSYCLFVDLDHFKMINDSLGHAVGDEVLLATAAILSDLVGSGGAVGRTGGDEFVALLDRAEYGDQAAAEAFGNQTLAALRAPLGPERPEVVTSASIGVVPVGDNDSLRDLLGRGDTALYAAKDQGRGRVVVGDETKPDLA